MGLASARLIAIINRGFPTNVLTPTWVTVGYLAMQWNLDTNSYQGERGIIVLWMAACIYKYKCASRPYMCHCHQQTNTGPHKTLPKVPTRNFFLPFLPKCGKDTGLARSISKLLQGLACSSDWSCSWTDTIAFQYICVHLHGNWTLSDNWQFHWNTEWFRGAISWLVACSTASMQPAPSLLGD